MYELTRDNIHDAAVSTLADIWSQIDWDKVTGKEQWEFGMNFQAR